MSRFNILLAEDSATFRELVYRELGQRSDFRVVGVSDGLAAVQKAEELRPDLVLLDVSLPALNGLAAARRIRSVAPESRIIFLTQESAPEIAHEALALGSQGYIKKTQALYLLPTVEAFLDRGNAGATHHSHQAQFYADDATLLEATERFLWSALRADDAAIAIATRSHLRQLLERLRTSGTNVDRAIERGSFLRLDANDLFSLILSDGVARLKPALLQAIQSAASATPRPNSRVAVFGECASMLLTAGHGDAAMELEQVGIEIVNTMSVDIMCTYALLPDHDGAFKTVCAQHNAVIVQ